MMPMDSEEGRVSRMLGRLPDYEPDARCSDRIRARCHAVLREERAKQETAPIRFRGWRIAVECAALSVVSAVYLVEVLRKAVALYGL